MMVIDVMVFVLSISYKPGVYSDLDHQQIVRDIASPLCPYTDFCHISAPKQMQYPDMFTSCCTECSCAEDCWKTNRCCPDSGISISNQSEFVCKETLVKQSENTLMFGNENEINGVNGGIKRYNIIDRCPENYQNGNLNKKCDGEAKLTLDDYLWVSDLQTGKIYQNQHCAQCNGVENWKRWEIRTDCINIIHTKYSDIADTILSDKCSIISVVPEIQSEAAARYKCYIPEYSTCNQTGKWENYDKDIDEACQLFNHIVFYQPLILGVTVFKNLFCFLCNSAATLKEKCPHFIDGGRTPDMPFSSLIDFGFTETEKQRISDCSLHELNDPYLKLCRKLICPLGQVAFYGECKQLITDAIGIPIRINFLLRILWDTAPGSFTLENVDAGQFGLLIHQKLIDALSILAIAECSECYSEIHRTNRSEFIFTVLFTITHRCSIDIMYKQVAEIPGSKIVIGIDNENISMAVDIERRSYMAIKEEALTLYFVDGEFICLSGVDVIEIACPTLQLNISESTSLSDKTLQEKYMFFFEGIEQVIDNASVYVCTKDYFETMAQSNTSPRRRKLFFVFFCLFIVFHFLQPFH